MIGDENGAFVGAQVRRFFLEEQEKGYTHFCGCDNRLESGMCGGHNVWK